MRFAPKTSRFAVAVSILAVGASLISGCGKKEEDTAGASSNNGGNGQATLNQGAPAQVARPNLDKSK